MNPRGGIEIAWAAQLACVFEVNAEKPGNVTRRANFRDARFEDFLASAVAVGPAFQDAARAAVGETILRAVRDTRRFVRTNTNLGVILLLGPLAKAAGQGGPEGLRAAVAHVLNGLTVEDARKTYEAIRLSAPSGLGQVERHGVHVRDVDVTLRQAMDLARGRDSVAREYVTDFEISLGLGYGTLRQSWAEGCTLSDSVVQTFLTVLAEVPDTLIARKKGQAAAEEVSRRAAEVLAAGGCLSKGGRDELARLDCDLRDESHVLNPGTTADLVAASLFAFLTEGGMLESVPDLVARW
ncbi:MAG: triphosphoribosyl-dephospho-CoA synthase [Thermoleophilia bacterium]|nr:triphosphoribosyl-dephospho-CoA synthase [Thermoleophilia bacterium]